MIFASRKSFHKSPFGAVAEGTPVRFTLTPPRRLAVMGLFLCVRDEFGGRYDEYRCQWKGLLGDCDVYAAGLDTSRRSGPLWYWFKFTRADGGTGYIGKYDADDGEGEVCYEDPAPWQQTVYDGGAPAIPGWFGRGVTYHIFPDRFRRLKLPEGNGPFGDRRVHRNWGGCPVYRPEPNGEITNLDFFGGSISGVREKLPYIASLGVTTIYFSPVFEAYSNHRYDTATYERVDPMLGTNGEFSAMCAEAAELGMRVMLDGVFNHTGYDSVYFNGRGRYPSVGAYQSEDSPYYKWYNFQRWPDEYSSWWGVYTLPQVRECDPGYREYIFGGEDSIVRRWLRAGASAWRLDVADELPDDFVIALRRAARAEKPDAVIIGEVWEDASNKISYGVRRRYAQGHELDGVMNYPLRNSLLAYILGDDAREFEQSMESLRENYPRDFFHSLMNSLGTHDTPRILTVLGALPVDWEMTKDGKAEFSLPPGRRKLAVARLKMASAVLYAFPGSPTVYYGDEAGLEGFEDPFNRRGYPWGSENGELTAWFAALGAARKASEALQRGDIEYAAADGGLLAFVRAAENGDTALLCCNREDNTREFSLPWAGEEPRDVMGLVPCALSGGELRVTVPPMAAGILI